MANPDLSAVLQTLSTFSQSRTQPPTSTSTSASASASTPAPSSKPPSHSPPSHSHSSSSSSSSHPKPSGVDPTRITTWPSALRFIMHTAANNPQFGAHIRRLISAQHALERKGWDEREALRRRQAGRSERKKELERVLQSVGATTATTTAQAESGDQQAENAIELAYHDASVHKATTELARSTAADLRRLGVPFFALDEGLILADAADTSDNAAVDTSKRRDGSQVSRQELTVLKRRMLELLQDLCRE